MSRFWRGQQESLGESRRFEAERRDQVRYRRPRRLRLGPQSDRRSRSEPLDGAAVAGMGRNGSEIAGRMDAGRSSSGAAANAIAQTHLGSGGPRRLMMKPVLDHIGIAVRSLETARIYSALGLSIDSVETVESQGVKT